MVNVQNYNLFTFLAAEQENTLVSVHRFRSDLNVLAELDGLYQAPINYVDVPEQQEVILRLLLFTHFHLYVTFANLVRMHISEALASTRKAIDAGLSAYEMILDPVSISEYLQGTSRFKFIKSRISNARKADPSSYSLAPLLIRIHERCSEFGSHADESSFVHRVSVESMPSGNKKLRLAFMHFQLPDDPVEAHWYNVDALLAYFHILSIFAEFIPRVTSKQFDTQAWRVQIQQLGQRIDAEWDNCCAWFEKREASLAASVAARQTQQ